MNLVNPLFEKQAVAMMIADPRRLDEIAHPRNPKLDRIGPLLQDPFTVCAWKALKTVRALNIPAIAAEMGRNGIPGVSVDRLNTELMIYARDGMAAPSIEWAISALESLWRARTATPIIEKYMLRMQAGMMTPSEMGQAIAAETALLRGADELKSINTDDWSPAWAEAQQKEQQELVAKGKLARIPPEFATIEKRVRFMESGILTILMDTGAGKSILVDILAHFWASQGLKVDMFVTETALRMQLWRYQLRAVYRQHSANTPLPQVQDLQEGVIDQRLTTVTKPYDNGGRVRYIAAGGAEASTCFAIMESDGAKVGIFDVAHDIRKSAWEGKGKNEASVLADMLEDVSTRCQDKSLLTVWTLQSDKAGRRNARSGGLLGAADAMGGSNWEGKSDFSWAGQFPVAEENIEIPHPTLRTSENKPVMVKVAQGDMLPVGEIRAAKGRTGGAGWRQIVWRTGEFYDISGINDPVRIEYYGTGYLWKKNRKGTKPNG